MTVRHPRPAREATTHRYAFPAGFRWGVATSAYQIEGAVTADGRGPSIWDTFCRVPGNVRDGNTGDVACDHYHRVRGDAALLAELGVTAYRFSVAWPRVQPTGSGPAHQPGLDFYRRLVDELLDHGIEPWLTLYHWDLPQALEDAGGWPFRDTAARFAEYAALVHGALGDRVHRWITINEPWCASFLGYASGVHAPGRRDGASAVRAAHHLLLGHGMAVQALQAAEPTVEVGLAVDLHPVTPASERPPDVDAARRIDGLVNRLFLDPVLRGRYPDDVVGDLLDVTDFGHIREGDLARIAHPGTFLAVNYSNRYVVSGGAGRADRSAVAAGSAWPGSEHVRFESGRPPVSATGQAVDPDGLTATLLRLHREYPALPVFLTGTGAAYDDPVDPGGTVHDRDRISFLDAYLRACHHAMSGGVPVGGFFIWSAFDAFEWVEGYRSRSGLIRVDFETQERTPKASADWYAQVITRHGLATD